MASFGGVSTMRWSEAAAGELEGDLRTPAEIDDERELDSTTLQFHGGSFFCHVLLITISQ
jgi:hypothetical protein